MAGAVSPRSLDRGNLVTFGGSEPSESFLAGQFSPSIAELRRYEEIRKLGEQVAKLESENSRLEGMIKEIGDMMSNLLLRFSEVINSSERDSNPAVIIVEEMDKSTAKRRVFDFMKEHGTSDIEELHENIRCDIGLLIEIIDELCSEGTICGGD